MSDLEEGEILPEEDSSCDSAVNTVGSVSLVKDKKCDEEKSNKLSYIGYEMHRPDERNPIPWNDSIWPKFSPWGPNFPVNSNCRPNYWGAGDVDGPRNFGPQFPHQHRPFETEMPVRRCHKIRNWNHVISKTSHHNKKKRKHSSPKDDFKEKKKEKPKVAAACMKIKPKPGSIGALLVKNKLINNFEEPKEPSIVDITLDEEIDNVGHQTDSENVPPNVLIIDEEEEEDINLLRHKALLSVMAKSNKETRVKTKLACKDELPINNDDVQPATKDNELICQKDDDQLTSPDSDNQLPSTNGNDDLLPSTKDNNYELPPTSSKEFCVDMVSLPLKDSGMLQDSIENEFNQEVDGQVDMEISDQETTDSQISITSKVPLCDEAKTPIWSLHFPPPSLVSGCTSRLPNPCTMPVSTHAQSPLSYPYRNLVSVPLVPNLSENLDKPTENLEVHVPQENINSSSLDDDEDYLLAQLLIGLEAKSQLMSYDATDQLLPSKNNIPPVTKPVQQRPYIDFPVIPSIIINLESSDEEDEEVKSPVAEDAIGNYIKNIRNSSLSHRSDAVEKTPEALQYLSKRQRNTYRNLKEQERIKENKLRKRKEKAKMEEVKNPQLSTDDDSSFDTENELRNILLQSLKPKSPTGVVKPSETEGQMDLVEQVDENRLNDDETCQEFVVNAHCESTQTMKKSQHDGIVFFNEVMQKYEDKKNVLEEKEKKVLQLIDETNQCLLNQSELSAKISSLKKYIQQCEDMYMKNKMTLKRKVQEMKSENDGLKMQRDVLSRLDEARSYVGKKVFGPTYTLPSDRLAGSSSLKDKLTNINTRVAKMLGSDNASTRVTLKKTAKIVPKKKPKTVASRRYKLDNRNNARKAVVIQPKMIPTAEDKAQEDVLCPHELCGKCNSQECPYIHMEAKKVSNSTVSSKSLVTPSFSGTL